MARGRGAKTSTQKGKGKKQGSSSSSVRKTKSVDEVTGIPSLNVPSPIKENAGNDNVDEVDEVTTVIPPVNMVNCIQKSIEKAALSGWLNVMQSGDKDARQARKLSWADETEKAQSEMRVSDSESVVMIESDDIQDKIDYWSSAVVCYVLGANPPFPVMEILFKRVWG